MSEVQVFELKFPFEHRGARYDRLTLRPPKVRDLKNFLRNMEKGDSIGAFEKVIGDLCEPNLDEKVISELHLKDFLPVKAWFEAFLENDEND